MNYHNKVQYIIPDEIFERLVRSFERFSSSINYMDARMAARDHLNASKSISRAEIIERYTELHGKKVLEVGSGCGTNLIIWTKYFNTDQHGVEPGSDGFESSYAISLELLRANGLNPSRISNSVGESLPYTDEHFDIVYSANVLEHTIDPLQVILESLRVLRPGGFLHFEMPNFLSYFEGHYMVPQPPLIWKWILPVWVKFIFGRDPLFAKTLRTEINPLWCKRTLKDIALKYPLELISLGEELFRERLRIPFKFETEMVSTKLACIMKIVHRLNRNDFISNLLISIHGFYPIYMTLQKR